MSENPFKPLETDPVTDASRLFHGRWAIWLVTCVLVATAVLSLVCFAYQVQCRDPLHGELYRDTPGAWLALAGHLLRGSVCAWMSIWMVRYLRALRDLGLKANGDYGALFAVTVRAWNALGCCVALMVCYAGLVFADATWGWTRWSMFAREDVPRFHEGGSVEAIPIEFREADYEPRDGLMRGVMTVIEPVEKVIYLGREAIVDNRDILHAKAAVEKNGRLALVLELTEAGGEKMERATRLLIDRQVAFIIDGRVEHVAIVRSAISRSVSISSQELTLARIEQIVKSINATANE